MNQLKEQVEANQVAMEDTHDRLSTRQDELEKKVDSMQTTLSALQSTFSTQFTWIRQMLDPKGDKGRTYLPSLDPIQKGLLGTPAMKAVAATPSQPNMDDTEGNGVKKPDTSITMGGNHFTNYKSPKYEFPKFDGDDDVIDWVQQCNCFFMINPMPANEKVMFTSLYLSGKARKWLFIRFKSLPDVSWEVFKAEITKRFSKQGYYNVVAELHELKQT